jgi:hypothetical protein
MISWYGAHVFSECYYYYYYCLSAYVRMFLEIRMHTLLSVVFIPLNKGTVVLVQAMKAYRGNSRIALFILNRGPR